MVNRLKSASRASDSEPDQSSHSDSDDLLFVPGETSSQNTDSRSGRTVQTSRKGRKRQRSVLDSITESGPDSKETAPVSSYCRPPELLSDSEESEDANPDVPHQRQRYERRATRRVRDDSDEDDEDGPARQTRDNAKVMEAVWTTDNTVRITYNKGVKHACMNPIHGKANISYRVLYLVRCTWKHNVKLMKAIPSTTKSKPYQYSHKLCETCVHKYGPHCFKCHPMDGDIVPKLDTVFGTVAILTVDDFTDAVRKWLHWRDEVEASYLVLHCTVLGPEAQFLRRKFGLKRSTTVHIVYSDVRDRMEPAGSGQNLEDSIFQNVWKAVMTEKVHSQDYPLISFFGNILLNDGVGFKDFGVNDMLVMYHPNIFSPIEGDTMIASINTLSLQLPLTRTLVEVAPSDCCLRNSVAHTHRDPMNVEDDSLFLHGNLVASLFYKGAKRHFGDKICAEFERRAQLGEQFKIGEHGHKLPFRKLFAAPGGEVQFRRVANATHDVPRRGSDKRSRMCSADTSGYELVCWTSRGAPNGGDFVIPGLMYKFETNSGSALVFRPRRYFHATLPTSNRDLRNEKFAASFVTPT